MMALALEMTALGLPPERVVRVLAREWYPTTMALKMATSYLVERPEGFNPEVVRDTDPSSMFLFFDPSALSALTFADDPNLTPDLDDASDTYFYGGWGIVRESLIRWTSGPISRVSLINVTALLDRLAKAAFGASENDQKRRASFFEEVRSWAEDFIDTGFGEGARAVATQSFLATYIANLAPPRPGIEPTKQIIRRIADETAFDERVIATALATHWSGKGDDDGDP